MPTPAYARRSCVQRPAALGPIRHAPNRSSPRGEWICWYIQAGRGWGKTRTGAEWIMQQSLVNARVAIVAATAADGRDTCVEGDSGIKALYPAVEWNRTFGELTFPSGCKGKVYAAETPERLRGPNNGAAWCDEMAAWRYLKETWDMVQLTLRKGTGRTCVTTTPKPYAFLKTIKGRPTTHLTRGRTADNMANLSPVFLETVVAPYVGTTKGRQELEAEDIDDVDGALWTRALLDATRVTRVPELRRIVVAVDPSATAAGDACGIVVAGKGDDNHGYVLDDRTLQASPAEWAREAVATYHRHRADRLVAEANQGGEMVALTIKTVDGAPPVSLVHASRGKITRAEPIAALFEQHRCHMVGNFAGLEDELCSYDGSGASPNRLDAMCYALSRAGIDVSRRAGDLVMAHLATYTRERLSRPPAAGLGRAMPPSRQSAARSEPWQRRSFSLLAGRRAAGLGGRRGWLYGADAGRLARIAAGPAVAQRDRLRLYA